MDGDELIINLGVTETAEPESETDIDFETDTDTDTDIDTDTDDTDDGQNIVGRPLATPPPPNSPETNPNAHSFMSITFFALNDSDSTGTSAPSHVGSNQM